MFERERTLYAFVLNYCRMLTADIDDARLADLPAAGANHPAWVLGHLAICTDYAAKLVGSPRVGPAEWHKKFGPGSKATADRTSYPSKADLLKALADGHERVSAAVVNADPSLMRQPQSLIFQEHFPTVADMIAHLMTTHPCVHLGQLSAWRRFHGLPSVLRRHVAQIELTTASDPCSRSPAVVGATTTSINSFRLRQRHVHRHGFARPEFHFARSRHLSAIFVPCSQERVRILLAWIERRSY